MIYLDNAATSFPKPKEVYEEVLRCMMSYAANPGRGSHDMSVKAATKIIECRQEISGLFNISSPFNVIFTCNATEGLNIAIKGLLKKGDHAISTVIEHNSVLRPLNSLTKKGLHLTLLGVNEQGYVDINQLKKEIRKKTKAIIVNHASNVLGTIQPIREIGKIAKDNGIIFIVDASQSAGVIPIDVQRDNIDILAFPGHKGLLGPQGTGGLYIKEGIKLDSLIEGGTGSNSNSMTQPTFLPDAFESGTLNTPGIAGLCEGIKFIKKEKLENIEKHELQLTEQFLSELKNLSYIKVYGSCTAKHRSSVISFNLDGIDCSKVGYLLNNNNIAVRTGYHCAPLIHGVIGTSNMGTVRLSPGYFNTSEDIDSILTALKLIYKNK